MELKDVCLGIDHAGDDQADVDGGDVGEEEEGEDGDAKDDIDPSEEGLGTGDAEDDRDGADPVSPVTFHVPYVEQNCINKDQGEEKQDYRKRD